MTKTKRVKETGVFQGVSRSADKFVVRLPDGLRQRVAERARATRRSMNSEIISALENHLGKPLSNRKKLPVSSMLVEGSPVLFDGAPAVIRCLVPTEEGFKVVIKAEGGTFTVDESELSPYSD